MEEKRWEQLIREKEGISYNKLEMASMAFPALMRKVYLWMTLALAITGITAYGVANNTDFIWTLQEKPWIMWVLIIAELGLVFAISGMIHKLSIATATILFIIYSLLNGVVLSTIFLAYTDASISKVFFITAGTFAVMSLVGYHTKRDLSSMGRILFMALIGIIIATVVNIFIKSSGLDLILCYLGVLVFVGLTAWDTQKIKNMLLECEEPTEEAQKIALIGSLSLYLDFINLFIYLLRIFGSRE